MVAFNMPEVKSIWGGTSVRLMPPQIRSHSDVIFLPSHEDGGGLYTESGMPISLSFPQLNPFNFCKKELSEDIIEGCSDIVDEVYFYSGHVLQHYGHALLSTLSRYWILLTSFPSKKILYHGVHPFSVPYIKFWLEGFGLSEESFVSFSSITRLRKLLIVEPSFEELNRASRVFANLCHFIARQSNSTLSYPRKRSAVYISKSKITSGVTSIVNECEIENEMISMGVDVVHPQTLSFSDQIRLFHEYEFIMGTACSAMHNSIFVKGGCRLSILTFQNVIHSNYILIDKINSNRSTYTYYELDQLENPGEFSMAFKILNPKLCSKALLERARRR